MPVYDDPDEKNLYDSDDLRGREDIAARNNVKARNQKNDRFSSGEVASKEKEGNSSGVADKLSGVASAVGAAAAPEAAAVGKVAKAVKIKGKGGRKKKALLWLGGGGIAMGLLALGVWTFLPQHVNSLMNFYESRAFRTVIKNLDDSAENFWEHYIRKHVLQALGPNCPDTRRDISCVPRLSGNDPASKAYNALIGANSEKKFFDRTGILFARDSQGRLFMTGPGLPDGGIDLKDFAEGRESLFAKLPPVSQAQARLALKEALAEQTFFRRAFMRFQLRDIMKKYSVLRCVVACDAREERRDNRRLRANAFKNYFFQRVLDPRNEGMREALSCLFDPNCNPDKVVDYEGPEGAPRTEFQVRLQNMRANLVAKGRNEKRIAAIEKRAMAYYNKGGKNYVTELILGEVVTKKVNRAIPIYGWVIFAAEVVNLAENSGPKVQSISYEMTASDMVGTYAMYRTVADEGKAGRVDEATMGSFSDSLTTAVADGNGNRSNAEATPLYEEFSTQRGSVTAFDIVPSASAAESESRYYRCNDGSPVPAGFLVCSEEMLRRGIEILSKVSDAIPDALASVASMATEIDDFLFGWITKPIGDFLAYLGQWTGLDDLAEDLLRDAAVAIKDYVIPSPVEAPTSGGRNGNNAAGGATVVSNDAAHYKLGGQVLSLAEYNELEQNAMEEERLRFSMLPLHQKLFDQENPYSLVSRVAMVMPGDMRLSLRDNFARIIINPFVKIMQGLASIFTQKTAQAGILPQSNPWGGTTYGWRSDNPIFDADPQEYWLQNCADGKNVEEWHKNTVVNDETRQLENTTPNGCLLIETTGESISQSYEAVTKEPE